MASNVGRFTETHCLNRSVLRMHSRCDLVASALHHQTALQREVDAHVGSVDLFFHHKRRVGDKGFGFGKTQVLVVVRPR